MTTARPARSWGRHQVTTACAVLASSTVNPTPSAPCRGCGRGCAACLRGERRSPDSKPAASGASPGRTCLAGSRPLPVLVSRMPVPFCECSTPHPAIQPTPAGCCLAPVSVALRAPSRARAANRLDSVLLRAFLHSRHRHTRHQRRAGKTAPQSARPQVESASRMIFESGKAPLSPQRGENPKGVT